MSDKVKRTERGWAGHLILSDSCKFRRNTLLEYKDKKWIVSTIGCFINSERKMDAIGYNRWYETMAFEGYEQNGYIEGDVSKHIDFDSEWGLWAESREELFEKYPHPDNDADKMHEAVVEELIHRLEEMEKCANENHTES